MIQRALTIATSLLLATSLVSSTHAGTFLKKQRKYPRVRAALKAHRADVEQAFRDAGAAWPPSGLYLRAFKGEGELELWAAPPDGEARVLVRTFPVCASSGVLGPKRQEGDFQVPEGFYTINRFNPRSSFHLSLGVDYPNRLDRARAGRASPGGDIFIHGDCVTVGCLPLEDGPVSWLYVAAVLARDGGQRKIPVHFFPCRFDVPCRAQLSRLAGDDTALTELWTTLDHAKCRFDVHKVPPRVRITRQGYELID